MVVVVKLRLAPTLPSIAALSIYDVRDILEGRMPSIGRVAPIIPIYDYRTTPTPPLISTAHIDFVSVDRGVQYVKPWQRNWWSVVFLLSDTYGDEDDS
jgi:hypothetical protein